MSAKRALARFRAPDETAAEERAWFVVRSAYQSQELPGRPRRRVSAVVGLAVALLTGAVALSPAGAAVGRLLTRALGIRHASPALSSLPAAGTLLVSEPAGTWTVAADGSIRRLGPWPAASWSPHGRYAAAVSGDQLSAVDPGGTTQWSLVRPSVSDPRWYSPSGYRIAYLSAGDLRVVAGDGSGDHLLATAVANVAPAWRPGHAYELAYVDARGTLVMRDGDTGRVLWSSPAGARIEALQWSADGRYLVAIAPTGARRYAADGKLVSTITPQSSEPVIDGALSPDGSVLAFVLGAAGNEVVLEDLSANRSRRVLAGPGLRQLVWSPDGHWLLVSWPAADQWVFVRVAGTPQIAAVSHIARQFSQRGVLPQLDGWCCTAR